MRAEGVLSLQRTNAATVRALARAPRGDPQVASSLAETRTLARMRAGEFNPHSIADDLQRAIDQADVTDGWTNDADGFHATTRKVDAEKVIADRPWLTRWRTVRHNHPIGRGRVTPRGQRYPSEVDMRGAERQARRKFRPQSELLDVATEQGPRSIPFGYDQTQKKPFWVEVPDASGVNRRERFTKVFEYQIWREQQTQGPG